MKRQRQDGLRKICGCSLRQWARCEHTWYFSHKPKGKPRVRISIDRHKGEHVASLDDAKTIAAELRSAIASGTYPPKPATGSAVDPVAVTFKTAAERFVEGVPILRGKNAGQARGGRELQKINAICAWKPAGSDTALGDYAVTAISEDMLEGFITSLRQDGRAASTVNKYVQTIRALDRWLTKKRYRTASALSGESETIKRRKGAKRDRRLEPDTVDDHGKVLHEGEERRLLKAASPWLQRLILAALETGCRRGELLSLVWGDVDLVAGELRIKAEGTKTGAGRRLPISAKLRAVLEMVRNDPAGNRLPTTALVFGNAIGEPVGTVKKQWETAVLVAHGHTPSWTASNALSGDSRAALRQIDLHFHDLRHEAGSRLLEAGWPLHNVQVMLGHADAKQTATYLNSNRLGLHESMKRYGTRPAWQTVAIDPVVEHEPSSHETVATDPQLTIN
jgi:integrase